jgi:hypothetical protein
MSTPMESAPNYITNWNECVQHFISCWPNEGCGYVTKDNVFVPCKNVAENPRRNFEIAAETFLHIEPKCIVHSHTIDNTKPLRRQEGRDRDYDPRIPTKMDMDGQIRTAVEWAICVVSQNDCSQPYFWGDFDHRPDLMQRQFIFNMNDCLAFMFDWFYKKWGVKLQAVAREHEFYKGNEDVFLNNYERLGFVDATNKTPEIGDVFLWKYSAMGLANVTNHCGVYVGDGQAVHHKFGSLPSVLSRKEVGEWDKYLIKRVRHQTRLQ